MTAPIATGSIPPEAGIPEISRRDVQSRLAGVGNLGGKNISPAQKEKKLRESCEGFESIFIQKMWEEMRKTLPKSTLLHGREEQFWQGMYDQELAKKMTSAGGIGLADMMYAQLSQNIASASRVTASGAAGTGQSAFAPEAAPMLPPCPPGAEQGKTEGSPGGDTRREAGTFSAASVYEKVAPAKGPAESENRAAVLTEADPAQVHRAQQVVAAAPQAERRKVVRSTNITGNRKSSLDLSRMAQFEAGTKLGPNTVRPSLQQVMGTPQTPRTFGTQLAARNQDSAGMNGLSIPPLTAEASVFAVSSTDRPTAVGAAGRPDAPSQGVEAPAADAVVPQQKAHYTANVPSGSISDKQGLARMRTVEAAGSHSVAGAGIAAYHAQQAAAGQAGAAPGSGTRLQSPLAARAGQDAVQAPAPTTAASSAAQGPDQTGLRSAQAVAEPAPLAGGQIRVRKGNGAERPSVSGIPPLTAQETRPR